MDSLLASSPSTDAAMLFIALVLQFVKWLCNIARRSPSPRESIISLRRFFYPVVLMDSDTDNEVEEEESFSELQDSDLEESDDVEYDWDSSDGEDIEFKLRVQRQKLKFEIEARTFEERRKRGRELTDRDGNIVPTIVEFFDTSDELVQELTLEFLGHQQMTDVQVLVREQMEVEHGQPLIYSVDGELLSPRDNLKVLYMVHRKHDNHLHIKFKIAKMYWHYTEQYIYNEHRC